MSLVNGIFLVGVVMFIMFEVMKMICVEVEGEMVVVCFKMGNRSLVKRNGFR